MPASRMLTTLILLILNMAHLVLAQASAGTDDGLRRTILTLDSAYFGAFNACDVERWDAFHSDDLEFYHDTGGFMRRAELVTGYRDRCAQVDRGELLKVRRELVPQSTRVYRIKDYGVIQIGTHRFYEIGKTGRPVLTSVPSFTLVWQQIGDGWKVRRALSYDH